MMTIENLRTRARVSLLATLLRAGVDGGNGNTFRRILNKVDEIHGGQTFTLAQLREALGIVSGEQEDAITSYLSSDDDI